MAEQNGSEWWNRTNAKPAGQSGLRSHTPDPSKYHTLGDDKMASHMGGGINATMIPRSKSDWTSRGFDANKPGPFQVIDPDNPGVTLIIDPAKLKNDALVQVLGEVGSVGTNDEESQQNMQNAYGMLAAGAAVTRQSSQQVQPMETQQQPAGVSPVIDSYEPQAPPPPRQQLQATVSANDSDFVRQQQAQMMDMMKMLSGIIQQQSVVAKTASPEPVPAPKPAPTVTVRSATADAVPAPAVQKKEDGGSFGIPYLSSVPMKPPVEVVFELGRFGSISARYHDVILDANCVVLVYDNRYEGTQFVPPQRSEDDVLILHVVKPGGGRTTFKVASFGLQFTIGCLLCIVLVPSQPEPVLEETEEIRGLR